MKLPYIVKANPITVIFISLFLLILPFIVWASMFKIEQTARAKGTVVTKAKTQSIQTANDGTIKEIHVKEGEYVKKGDILVTLDKNQYEAEYESVEKKIKLIEESNKRLEAEISGATVLNIENKDEKELFVKKIKSLESDLSTLNNSLKLAKEELGLMIPLAEKGDVGSIDLIRLKRQVSDIEGQINSRKTKFYQDDQAELVKNKQDLILLKEELKNRKVNLERTNIVAPVDGVINNILITTTWAKIKPGDVIMEIVPEDLLLVEIKLSPMDISYVKKGQKAFVKVDAYDYSIFGGIKGEVLLVGSDALVATDKENYYFKVLIGVEGKSVKTTKGNDIVLSPGMGVEADIITAERSILTYLVKPIVKTLDSSFKER